MTNIFVNAVNLKVGGGEAVLEGYLGGIYDIPSQETIYYVLTPNYKKYKSFEKKSIKIIPTPPRFIISFLPLYYLIYLPYLFRKFKVEIVINFGDIILPTHLKQIYFFDWAYAVYNEKYVWKKMSLLLRIKRRTKVFLIDITVKKFVDVLYVQTDCIKNRIINKYAISKVISLPTPINLPESYSNKKCGEVSQKPILFYPASFGGHKNHFYLIEVARIGFLQGKDFTIKLTFTDKEWEEFSEAIDSEIRHYFVNVGVLNRQEIWSCYHDSDIVIIPSLLESYGLPFFEAMYAQKPIFASDLDFAHSACKNAAVYINPFKPNSTIEAIDQYLNRDFDIHTLIKNGTTIVNSLPSWSQVASEFEKTALQLSKNKITYF